MTEADLPSLVGLCHEMGYEVFIADLRSHFKALAANDDHAFFICADSQDFSVGFLEARIDRSILHGHQGEVSALVVSQGFRRQGIGTKLIKAAEDWVKSKGAKEVIIRTNIKRTSTHEYYTNLKYDLIKTAHYFSKKLN